MRILLCTLVLFTSMLHVSAQQKGVIVSKVTATWCPNCGSWGWNYFEALRDIYTSNPDVCLIGVHHSGDLLNPTSNWFSGNLDNFYQPEFYVNNEQIDVLSFNWNQKVAELEERVSAYQMESSFVNFDFIKAYTESGEIICKLAFGPTNKSDGDYYFGVYVFENNVANFQSSRGMEMHPNVLRDVMSDNFYGDLYVGANQSAGSRELEFLMDIDPEWDEDELGLVAIMWREDNGRYILQNARAIYNLSLLSSQEEIQADMITVSYLPNGIRLQSNLEEKTEYQLFSPAGQLLEASALTGQYIINTEAYPAGLYVLHLRNGNRVLTKQLAIIK